jgi:3',5'-cyclic AMP phosphodiesterase CpdA
MKPRILIILLSVLVLLTSCGHYSSDSGGTVQSTESTALSDSQYTFAWMSDTQYYSASYPEIFQSMTEWIADQKDAWQIKAVFHTGDLVDDASKKKQWQNAVSAMSLLGSGIPYTVLAGNKDVSIGSSDKDYSEYLQYFGKTEADSSSVLRSENGEAMALLFEAGTSKYIAAALGWEADSSAFSWVNDTLQKYADRIGIITTHDYLKSDASLSTNGEEIFSRIIKPNANVRLVLCGHKYSAAQKTTEIDDNGDGTADRKVLQLIADYQNSTRGGNGYLRLLTVDEKNRTLSVKTYSPYVNQYNCFSAEQDEFSLSISDWWN